MKLTSERKILKLNTSSKEDLISLVKLQQVKIKSLQQKVRRRKQNKIKSLNNFIDKLSKYRLVSPAVDIRSYYGPYFNDQHKMKEVTDIATKQNKSF